LTTLSALRAGMRGGAVWTPVASTKRPAMRSRSIYGGSSTMPPRRADLWLTDFHAKNAIALSTGAHTTVEMSSCRAMKLRDTTT
jgi:hypothetical protein